MRGHAHVLRELVDPHHGLSTVAVASQGGGGAFGAPTTQQNFGLVLVAVQEHVLMIVPARFWSVALSESSPHT